MYDEPKFYAPSRAHHRLLHKLPYLLSPAFECGLSTLYVFPSMIVYDEPKDPKLRCAKCWEAP